MNPRRSLARLAVLTVALSANAALARAQFQVSTVDLNHPRQLRKLSHRRLEVFPGGNATVVLAELHPDAIRPPSSTNREQILVYLTPAVLKKRRGPPESFSTDELVHRLPGDVFAGFKVLNTQPSRVLSIVAQGPQNTHLTKDQAAAADYTPLRLTDLRKRLAYIESLGTPFSIDQVVKEGTLTASLALLRGRRTWKGPATRELLLLGLSGSATLAAGGRTWTLSPHVIARIPNGYPNSITLSPHGVFSMLIVASSGS